MGQMVAALLKERDKLKKRLEAIDIVIQGSLDDQEVLKRMNDYPDKRKEKQAVDLLSGYRNLKVGDQFKYTGNVQHGPYKSHLTFGKVYVNRQPGSQLVLEDDTGKIRKYAAKTVAYNFKYMGHVTETEPA